MKKILSLVFVAGALMTTAACSSDGNKGMYSNDSAAPYASERTAGAKQENTVMKAEVKTAEPVFESRLIK
jgi:hypothetical protein|tara:strand:- start:2547 stop:2756 length:210 start_codon:yes stop_codon:yes gene_type:complete